MSCGWLRTPLNRSPVAAIVGAVQYCSNAPPTVIERRRRNTFVGFAVGMITGVVATIVLTGGEELPSAMAQAEQQVGQAAGIPVACPRYQISAVGSVSAPGALIIDSQTGVVWRYVNEGVPLKKVARVPTE